MDLKPLQIQTLYVESWRAAKNHRSWTMDWMEYGVLGYGVLEYEAGSCFVNVGKPMLKSQRLSYSYIAIPLLSI